MRAARDAFGLTHLRAKRRWREIRQLLAPSERHRLRATRRFVREYGLRVRGGPFAGLTYVDQAVGRVVNLVPRLLGSYECELHEPIERAIANGPETIVNIGSADGYYAVGLARRLPKSVVYAFELDPFARDLCAHVAWRNGVSRQVRLRPAAGTRALATIPHGKAFVIVDCEGCELDVLRPQESRLLATSDVLVEVHDFARRGVAATILDRFGTTHDARLISAQDRSFRDYPELDVLPRDEAESVVRELRWEPPSWVLLTPRDGAGTGTP